MTLYIDFIKTHRYFLILIDIKNKKVLECIELPRDIEEDYFTNIVADFLDNNIYRVDEVITDYAHYFWSAAFEEVCSDRNIKHKVAVTVQAYEAESLIKNYIKTELYK